MNQRLAILVAAALMLGALSLLASETVAQVTSGFFAAGPSAIGSRQTETWQASRFLVLQPSTLAAGVQKYNYKPVGSLAGVAVDPRMSDAVVTEWSVNGSLEFTAAQ